MESDCWLWTAGFTTVGYGKFAIGKDGRRAILRDAHRMAWTLANGEIADGMWVCHRCDVRACVRPDHLFLGTVTDNNVDMYRKGRGKRQRADRCPLGHFVEGENAITVQGKTGPTKRCRICSRDANNRSYAKRHRLPPLP